MQWCDFWNDFLNERTSADKDWEYVHARLRKARRSLVKLVNDGTLFTYLDPELTVEGPLPAMNNVIEGGVNAQLRDILRNHRGLRVDHRVKAVYWWCYLHTECPKKGRCRLTTTSTCFARSIRETRLRAWTRSSGATGSRGQSSITARLTRTRLNNCSRHTFCPLTQDSNR